MTTTFADYKTTGEEETLRGVEALLEPREFTVQVQLDYVRVGGATPGVALIIGAVFSVFGPLPIGVTAVRKIAGTSTWSQHAYGNAVDFMVGEPSPLHHDVAFFLDSMRGPLHVNHLLADPWFPSPLGDHFNHCHVDPHPAYGGTPPGHPIE